MKNNLKQLFKACLLLIGFMTFTSCEKEEVNIITNNSYTKSDVDVRHSELEDLSEVVSYLNKKSKRSLTQSKSGATYLETVFGKAYIDKGLVASNEEGRGSISFNIIPNVPEEGVVYNLVIGLPFENEKRESFIAKYVQQDSDTIKNSQRKFYRFKIENSLKTNDKMLVCPPDDIVTPPDTGDAVNQGTDGTSPSNGNNTGGGNNGDTSSNPTSPGSPDSSTTNGGTPTYSCWLESTFVKCGGPEEDLVHSPQECGKKPDKPGSYYIDVYQCFQNSNRSASRLGCPAVPAPTAPIVININIPIHQFSLIDLIGDKLSLDEINWIKLIENNPMTIRILGYVRDNNSSEAAKQTAANMVRILAGTGSINSLTKKEEFKAFMSVISDGIKNNSIEYTNPSEFVSNFSEINIESALSDVDLSVLSIADWRFMTQKALTIKDNVSSWDANNYDDSQIREIAESVAAIIFLPNVKELSQDPAFYPQTAEEWGALAEVMGPMLLEVGLAFIPGADIIDVIKGLENRDYLTVTMGLAGLTVDAFGGTILKVVAKFGEAAYKSFKIIRALGDALTKAASVVKKGFKYDLENGEAVIRKAFCGKMSNCPIIARGDDVARVTEVMADLTDPLAIKRIEDYLANNIKVVKQDGKIKALTQSGDEIGEVLENGLVKGKFSGRTFDPAKAGGPIKKMDWQNVSISDNNITMAEKHTNRFVDDITGLPDPSNVGMIERLKKIKQGEIQATDFDKRFLTHEIREYERYRNLNVNDGVDPGYDLWNDAHSATLEDFSINEFIDFNGNMVRSLYHPSVQ